MESQTARTQGVIPRWEPHEAHQFTKPYSRSSKPEWVEESKPVKMSRKATKTPPTTGGGRKKPHN